MGLSHSKPRRQAHGDNRFNGVTPAFIICNLLQRYTKPGDLVVDPMAGSGTTIDVTRELGRKVIGYDIAPYREDIIQNDARQIPLEDNSVDFIFIDSPYSDNVKYSNHPDCIGKISCEGEKFFDELEKVAKEIHRILKPEKVMAWLIGDHWRKKNQGLFLWALGCTREYLNILKRLTLSALLEEIKLQIQEFGIEGREN